MTTMIDPNNTNFAPPIPNSTIINDGGDGHITVKPGKTYRLRMINWAAMFSMFVQFDSLNMNVISIDSSYVQKKSVKNLRISAAQRSDVLVTIPEDADRNYPYLVAMDLNQDYADPEPPRPIQFPVQKFEPFDDSDFSPHDDEPAYGPVTKQWVLNFD